MYDKEWPVRQPVSGPLRPGVDRPSTHLWRKLEADPTVEEVLRNFPVRQPVLWI